MIIIVALLALPLGFFLRNRTAAYVVYGLAFAHVYTFQTANLVMEWVNGADAAFAQSTSASMFDASLGYFTFTTAVLLVGYALVAFGQWLRAKRARGASRHEVADLEAQAR